MSYPNVSQYPGFLLHTIWSELTGWIIKKKLSLIEKQNEMYLIKFIIRVIEIANIYRRREACL